ncbi:MAG: hypothetical protein ACJAXX_002367 [Roseivirga sp.]|jgi:hypothetical protein
MKKTLLIACLIIGFNQLASAQAFFSMYQLRDVVPQSQGLQPAFIPNNTFTLGLPTVGASATSQFKIQDLLSKGPNDFNYKIDFDVLLAASADINKVNAHVVSNLFYVGLKTKKGGYSLFLNARVTAGLKYGRDFMEFLANGNSNRIGASIDFKDTQIAINSYHEVGIGHARTFLDKRLTVGVRAKVITGLFNVSSKEGLNGQLFTNPDDFSWTVTTQNGTINTAGIDYLTNADNYEDNELTSYLVNNKNRSVAFDLGVKLKITNRITVEAAMNDIGTIEWQEQTINYNTYDTTVVISGVELRGLDASSDVFRDSIQNKFRSDETNVNYKTRLNSRTFVAAAYNFTPKDRVTFMAFNNSVFGEIDPSFALAYNHTMNKFIIGLVASKRGPENEYNIGANIASDIGPVQLYLAADNALITNRPERFSKIDFRFGLNLMFGYKRWKAPTDYAELDDL